VLLRAHGTANGRDFLIQLGVRPVPERLEEWAQLFEITLDRPSRVVGFPCSRRRSFVGVSHDRPVRGIGCLRELQVQVSRDTTSVNLLRKDGGRQAIDATLNALTATNDRAMALLLGACDPVDANVTR
jgi:hypothetical protein